MSFNLLDEPWITAIDDAGQERDVSIREVFDPAQHLLRISGELPTQGFAILRLLVAITTDAYELRDPEVWRTIVDEGIDYQRVGTYLDRWDDRFELFDDTAPFMQVADLHTSKDQSSTLDKLIAEVPNGVKFFTPRLEASLRSISAAEAARWLVHAQAFDPKGIRSAAVGDPQTKDGKGYPFGVAWAGQLGGIVIHGEDLCQTIALNCPLLDAGDTDRPVWAVPPLSQLREDFTDRPTPGTLRLLTWQSRRVRLVGGPDGVTGVVLCQGDKMTSQNRIAREPMTAWRLSDPQSRKAHRITYMPLKHDPTRAFWRSLPHVINKSGPGDDRWSGAERWLPATTVRQLGNLTAYDADFLPEQTRLQAVGITYGNNESVIDEIVDESLGLSTSLLRVDSPEIGLCIEDAVDVADKAVRVLGDLAVDLALAAGESGDDAGTGAKQRTQVAAWAELNVWAADWIGGLTATSDPVEATKEWQQGVCQLLAAAGTQMVNDAPDQAVRGHAVGLDPRRRWVNAAVAYRRFTQALSKTLPHAALAPSAAPAREQASSPTGTKEEESA